MIRIELTLTEIDSKLDLVSVRPARQVAVSKTVLSDGRETPSEVAMLDRLDKQLQTLLRQKKAAA